MSARPHRIMGLRNGTQTGGRDAPHPPHSTTPQHTTHPPPPPSPPAPAPTPEGVMRPPHRLLNRNHVHRLAAEHLQAHLKFKDYKRKVSTQVLWSLLLAAAARITSLSDACQRLRDGPSDETARKALLATLPDYATLQRQLNAALAGYIPRTLRKQLQRLAIDLTLIPYHGEPFRDLNEIYRGQPKDGTSHFHAYASAYVVKHGQRYTVALTGVTTGEPLKDVVQRLLQQAARVGIRPRLLLRSE